MRTAAILLVAALPTTAHAIGPAPTARMGPAAAAERAAEEDPRCAPGASVPTQRWFDCAASGPTVAPPPSTTAAPRTAPTSAR